jgi:guanylate kinase
MLAYKDVFVISAPSGAGKTTINKRLIRELNDIELSVSYTTRTKRPGEVDGKDYWFKTKEEFQQCIDSGRMLEWAKVFTNYYGTSIDELKRISSLGKRILLEIDVQGWHQAKKKLHDVTSIFILPPSGNSLFERLQKRGTESSQTIKLRVNTAKKELSYGDDFQYFVINDDLEQAYEEVKNLISAGAKPSLSRKQALEHCNKLIKELNDFDRSG